MERILNTLRNHRKIVLPLTDISILTLFFLAIALLCRTYISYGWVSIVQCWVVATGLIILTAILSKTYKNMWRHAGAKEYMLVINVYGTGFVCFFILNKLVINSLLPESFVLLAIAGALITSLYVRVLYRLLMGRLKKEDTPQHKRNLAIIGAGNAGVTLQEEISRNTKSPYTVWGFFDDDPAKKGLYINNFKVHGPIEAIVDAVENNPISDVVLAIPSLEVERRREIVELLRPLPCQIRIMPDAMSLVGQKGNNLEKAMREVKVEDLLGRTSVHFDRNELDTFVRGKTVLVSGGGGSIGSEIARQLVQAEVRRLIIFDINENDSYVLHRELMPFLNDNCEVRVEIGSMTDAKRVNHLFAQYRPDVVFHAAAHKHVPLMEYCPYEAVYNNVFGTYNLLKAAQDSKCPKFVLISTDKAVNPTNIMGATKRYCEDMARAFANEKGNTTDFLSVRFGNVLGSHGSVIPLFQMQIAQGGPVTITDKRITRYFMTIPEAAGLVIKAGAMAKCSETYILDMGEPVRIVDLAENLIRLSGFEPYTDIPIVETGLRPGEKLYEELLVNDELHIATGNSKIFIERNEGTISMATLMLQLHELKKAVENTDNERVLQLMRRFVPNFRKPEEVNSAVNDIRQANTVSTVEPQPKIPDVAIYPEPAKVLVS